MSFEEFSFLLPENMKRLGFDNITEEVEPGYYKYQNDGTKHYNIDDYSMKDPEPKALIQIRVKANESWFPSLIIYNMLNNQCMYNGICPDEDFLLNLLKNVR